MNRTVVLGLALSAVVLAVWWGPATRGPGAPNGEAGWTAWDLNPGPETRGHAHPPGPRDTLSRTGALHRLERLHRLRADLLRARAAGDAKQIDRTLSAAMSTLEAYRNHPTLAARPQFRRAFRHFTSAYEHRYGVPDTLRLPPSVNRHARLLYSSGGDGTTDELRALPATTRRSDVAVPLPINEPVRERIDLLLHQKERYLYPWLRRAATYFPMIEQIFATAGVPDVIKYLALAESGLNPRAQSRAQAAGIWQFVPKTARRYGLTIDPWIDERRDPVEATRAAARHLKDLHRVFGDWHLALAGYNCDPGLVRRLVYEHRRRTGHTPSFWDLYDELPDETRAYVPLFIATARILSRPAAYDLRRVRAGPRYAFDRVPVEGALRVERVARMAGVSPQHIRRLNPELRGDRLPPAERPYHVRLPYGSYETFRANYARQFAGHSPPRIKHVVRAGETVGRIAQRYQVDRAALLRTNDVTVLTVQAGDSLVVPETSYADNAAAAARSNRQPIRVRYGRRTIRPLGKLPMSSAASSIAAAP